MTSPTSTEGPGHVARRSTIGDTGELPVDLEELDARDARDSMYRQATAGPSDAQKDMTIYVYRPGGGAESDDNGTTDARTTSGFEQHEVVTSGKMPDATPGLTNASSSRLGHNAMYGKSGLKGVTAGQVPTATPRLAGKSSTEL